MVTALQRIVSSLVKVLSLFLSLRSEALENVVSRLPPLGYNTWNDLGCNGMSEENVQQTAQAMLRLGLRQNGYEYINLDDCWQDPSGRDPQTGELRGDPKKFPSGMKALGDYLHKNGLKFGIYTDRGTKTCAGRPASLDHEELDAKTFASWGVDFVKIDNCHSDSGPNNRDTIFLQFRLFRDALNETGRPIFYSVCGGGDELPFADLSFYATDPRGAANLANSWRISADVIGSLTYRSAYLIDAKLAQYAGPGAFNDPDMLLGTTAGSTRTLSRAKSRTQFSLWAILMAPLLIGTKLQTLDSYDLETYSNAEVIAINQDPLMRQGQLIHSSGLTMIWGRYLFDHSWALLFVSNAWFMTQEMICSSACWSLLGFPPGTNLTVRDLWLHDLAKTSLAVSGQDYSVKVPPRGASVLLRFFPERGVFEDGNSLVPVKGEEEVHV